MKQIVLASNNLGKIGEFNAIFNNIGIKIITQQEFNVPECDEPYFTFIENALHKARHCTRHTGLPALADDSGVCVNALMGAPGVFSARYAGIPTNSQENNKKLVVELANFTDKSAYYYCMLVLLRHEHDPQPIIAEGMVNGMIVDIPRGTNGFGYDPHMFLPEYNQTIAEIDSEIKNKISHRALAIKELLKKISTSNAR